MKDINHRGYVYKGFIFIACLTIGTDIDRDVSTGHCRSSSGDGVDLLSRTICTTVVVSDGWFWEVDFPPSFLSLVHFETQSSLRI